MSKEYHSECQSNDGYPEEIVGQYVMELPVFDNKKLHSAPNSQHKKKILKPIRVHTLSATRRQCTSNTPYQTIYSVRTGARSNTTNINNLLTNDHILRIKQLENGLTEARNKTRDLIIENRLLKTLERRHENALSVYEGTQAKLPQMIKSYEEDIRLLQGRIRQMKISHKEMENRYRSQSTELLALQKQHRHLLDLSKNKQLSKREKLSHQLEEAQNIIKQQDTKIQNLMKKLELQNKTHRHQLNSETTKIKELQLEVKHLKEENQKLEFQLDKLKNKNYGVKQNFSRGVVEDSISITPRVKTLSGQGDEIKKSMFKTNASIIATKPESSNDDSNEEPYEEFEDIYQTQNRKISPAENLTSNKIKNAGIQVADKLYSLSPSTSKSLLNQNLAKLSKENMPEQSTTANNDFKNQDEHVAKTSRSLLETSMSRLQKDLLLAKLNKVSEDNDNYDEYYTSEFLKKPVNRRFPSLVSKDESSGSSISD